MLSVWCAGLAVYSSCSSGSGCCPHVPQQSLLSFTCSQICLPALTPQAFPLLFCLGTVHNSESIAFTISSDFRVKLICRGEPLLMAWTFKLMKTCWFQQCKITSREKKIRALWGSRKREEMDEIQAQRNGSWGMAEEGRARPCRLVSLLCKARPANSWENHLSLQEGTDL